MRIARPTMSSLSSEALRQQLVSWRSEPSSTTIPLCQSAAIAEETYGSHDIKIQIAGKVFFFSKSLSAMPSTRVARSLHFSLPTSVGLCLFFLLVSFASAAVLRGNSRYLFGLSVEALGKPFHDTAPYRPPQTRSGVGQTDQ